MKEHSDGLTSETIIALSLFIMIILFMFIKGGMDMLAHQGSFTLILVLFILLVIICGIC